MTRILTVLLALLMTAGTALADGAAVGKRAPEFDSKAKTPKGKKFRLKAYKGKWIAVTFGAHWCEACKDELPAWDKLARKYKDKVTFIAVNIDNDEKKREKFLKKLKLKNLVIVYSPEEDTSTADSYVGGDDPKFPTTFVIDPNGVIRHVHREYHPGDDKKMIKAIDKLLKKR